MHLIDVVGLNFLEFKNRVGEVFLEDPDIANYEDEFHLVYEDDIEAVFCHENDSLQRLYVKSRKAFSFFTIPGGINLGDSIDVVRKKLGPPALSGKEKIETIFGIVPPWDKYFFDRLSLHIEYSSWEEKKVKMVTIESR